MTDNTEFHPERLDVWTDTVEFAVERDRTVAYALATNDPIAAHRDGTLAPPVFAGTIRFSTGTATAMTMMADATLGIVPDDLMFRILHGEHDFRFHRPIKPGETLAVRAKPIGIEASRRAWW